MLDFNSSLVDLAIFRESAKGRRVYMDFNRNPLLVPNDQPFSLDRLDADVSAYLQSAGANHAQPIDRLRHMNPLAIELYRRYKVDITVEPLEFAVNNQHMNGGIAVDTWGRSNLGGIYAIGEAAGTHGVTRPGGSALNAGQVFGTRVAEHLAASGMAKSNPNNDIADVASQACAHLIETLNSDSPLTIRAVRDEVQARMSDHAGILCYPEAVDAALAQAQRLNAQIRAQGIAFARPSEMGRALQWQQMALASEAVLAALHHYIQNDGGSRGARAICDPKGDALPQSNAGPLHEYRFRSETADHQNEQITVQFHDDQFRLATRQNRSFDTEAKSFFERDWPAWLTGEIYDLDRR